MSNGNRPGGLFEAALPAVPIVPKRRRPRMLRAFVGGERMPLQTASDRRTSWGSRALIGLVSAVLGLSGCAHSPSRTMARVWSDLPKVRWDNSREELPNQELTESQLGSESP